MNILKILAHKRRNKRIKQRILRLLVSLFVWIGGVTLYYIGFSLFFDTPLEHDMKHQTDLLRQEYTSLTERYDSLMVVMENLSQRDRNVFQTLFESSPHDFDSEYLASKASSYERNIARSSSQLYHELDREVADLEQMLGDVNQSYKTLQEHINELGSDCDYIPAIQPVINKQLTLLTASYGMRYHPFYKTLQSHQGVDYTIPEGSRVFATAKGQVSKVMTRNSTSGMTIVIDHGNGYETSYHHLKKTTVRQGQTVHRGDIIALSGNTGLSLAPHLHYEVRYNGMRVDPIHYFFMELSPTEYRRLMHIAQIGMQSFD